jgi:hypothetical protein
MSHDVRCGSFHSDFMLVLRFWNSSDFGFSN